MLKPDLDELIELYELEKNNLNSLIQECITDWDYKGAHYHSKALRKINRKLQTLLNLKDPLYDRKSDLEMMKSQYKQDMTNAEYAGMQPFLQERINKIEEELKTLNEKSISKPESQEFDDAIYDLIERRINGFTFHLKKEENMYLHFKLKEKNILVISFTPMGKLGEYSIMNPTLTELKLIGFKLNSETDCLEYVYDTALFKNSIFLKTLVSRIVFDAFYFKEFDKPAYIVFE